MEIAYYNLAGGINQASTKTELGLDTKKVYWTDSFNVEILQSKGICKQQGNTLFLELPEKEPIVCLHELFCDDVYRLIIVTLSGKLYVYDDSTKELNSVSKVLLGKKIKCTNFLRGVVISSEKDAPFYLNLDLSIESCNLSDNQENPIFVTSSATFRGRIWFASASTIYYSALGTYNDFQSENDAGYISDFHTDTSDIIAVKPYKDYLAIYKKDNVYLLQGTSPEDFVIIPFASKGCIAPNSIVNVENKQYFLSNGIFALEQVGELNQIQLGTEISKKIKPEIEKFNPSQLAQSFCIHYENKSQIWYFLPYPSEEFYHTVWINDYLNKAWYKRKIPQSVTTAGIFKYQVLTADNTGKIYKEDYGTTFDGQPIDFMWKSPFFAIGSPHHRKVIDEFYFILDEAYDNNFDFVVYKDYDSQSPDDIEKIYSVHLEHMIWADENTHDNLPCHWTLDEENIPVWTVSRNSLEKAEISESNYAIQLCVQGNTIQQSCAIIGLQFREIYNDD